MALPAGAAMNPEARFDDVEALLSRDARARLPLWRQLLLYLNPFALFKDAARGPAWMRERALAYNRAMRWVLLTYVRRYVLMAAVLFLGIAPAEALAAEASILIIPAGRPRSGAVSRFPSPPAPGRDTSCSGRARGEASRRHLQSACRATRRAAEGRRLRENPGLPRDGRIG
jgi:hypothetical protein